MLLHYIREACKKNIRSKTLRCTAYLVDLFLLRNKIAEMKTGEGKTLVSTLPISTYGLTLTERSVHVVTVNDYLSKRDAEWMRTNL